MTATKAGAGCAAASRPAVSAARMASSAPTCHKRRARVMRLTRSGRLLAALVIIVSGREGKRRIVVCAFPGAGVHYPRFRHGAADAAQTGRVFRSEDWAVTIFHNEVE